MTTMKYSKYIITEAKPIPPEIRAKMEVDRPKRKSTVESTHIMQVDSEVIPDMFYVDCVWLWKGSSQDTVEAPHSHSFDEVIGFVGSNQDDPWNLGGKITIWLDGEGHTLTRSSLIFVPAGARHCPIRFDRIDSPIFFTTMSPSKTYDRKDEENKPDPSPDGPKCTIVSELTKDFSVAADGSAPPPPPKSSDIRGQRVLHLEDDVIKGSFYVDFVWIYEGNGGAPAPEHNHEWEELIAMAGCDPEHPNDLGGTMSIVLGGETHYITKSSLVCIPKNLKHCPWLFHDIKKPTLVFTAGPSAVYTGSHRQQQ